MRYLLLGFITSCMLMASSCNEETITEITVLGEDVVYLSAERVVLTGRIAAAGPVEIEDHGFLISTDDQLGSPLTLSIGQKGFPGLFVAETIDLEPGQQYYFAAFADVAGSRILSEVQPFLTLRTQLESFSPLFGVANATVTIHGVNFTEDTQVFFGSREAEVIEIIGESIVKVRIPPIGDSHRDIIRVLSHGINNEFAQQYEYVIGRWELVNELAADDRAYRENIYMESDDYFAFGLGDVLFSMNISTSILLRDKRIGTWTELTFPGLSGIESFGAWPYMGSGAFGRIRQGVGPPISLKRSAYKIEDGAIEPIADMPVGLFKSVAYHLSDGLYVMGGFDTDLRNNREVYHYDQLSDQWSNPGSIVYNLTNEYLSWQYNDHAYYLGENNIVMTYNPNNMSWDEVTTFPAQVLENGLAQVIGDKVYVGLFLNGRTVWELNLVTLEWKRKKVLPGDFRSVNAGTWTSEGKIFMMRYNQFLLQNKWEVWSLSPDQF